MTTSFELSRQDTAEAAAASDRSLAPGRATLTARLAPSPRAVANELMRVMRKQDGAATPGADAASALARASASTGAPLPAELRARFEASLGADLSSVRVHTDAASGAAARAVGARAYTIGNDIHFGAGHYAPTDPFGVHLLAHEVAHTVQQQGATPVRQHQLEVSAPGDRHELEADRAADAMVSGAPATITSMTGLGIHRDALGEMQAAGNAADAAGGGAAFDGVTTVDDRATAAAVKDAITASMPFLLASKTFAEQHSKGAAGPFDFVYVYADRLPNGSHIAANQQAMVAIDAFLTSDDRRAAAQSHTAAHTTREEKDYDRLIAECAALLGSARGRAGQADPSKNTSEQVGDRLVDSAAGQDGAGDSMNADFQRALAANPQLADAVKVAKTELDNASAAVADSEKHMIGAQATMQGQAQALSQVQNIQSAGRHQAKADAAAREVAEINNAIKTSLDALSFITGTGALSVDKSQNGWKVADLIVKGLKVVADLQKVEPGTDANSEKNQADDARFRAGIDLIVSALNNALGAATTFDAAKDTYADSVVRLNKAKAQYRTVSVNMGTALDHASGRNQSFALVAQLLADCDNYVAQADATLAIAKTADQQQDVADLSTKRIQDPDGTGQGIVYFTAQFFEQVFDPFGPNTNVFVPVPHHLRFQRDPADPSSGAQTTQARAPLDQDISDITAKRQSIVDMSIELRHVFGGPAGGEVFTP